jgi:O-antigen ligase
VGPRALLSSRAGLLLVAGVFGLGVLVTRPTQSALVFVVLGLLVATRLAFRSPAIPLAVWSGALLIPLITGTLPRGATVSTFAAWMLLAVGIALFRPNRERPPLSYALDLSGICTLLLVALLLLRLPASLSPGYGSQKIQLFVLVGVLPFVAGVLIGFVRRDLLLFLGLLAGVTLAAAILDVYLVATGRATTLGSNRLSISGSTNPIGLARIMGELILLLLFFITQTGRRGLRPLLLLALIPATVAFFSAGSRGPLIGLVLAVPTLVLWGRGNPRVVKRLLLTLSIGGVAAAIAVGSFVPGSALQRGFSIFGNTGQAGEVSRYTLWQEAVSAIGDNWKHVVVGEGTGSFAAIDIYQEKYPHNIFLELWVELGIVGTIIFAVGIGSAFVRLGALTSFHGETGALAGLIFSLLMFDLVNAFVSSDITGNAGLWQWMGLGSGLVASARVGAGRRVAGRAVLTHGASEPRLAFRATR